MPSGKRLRPATLATGGHGWMLCHSGEEQAEKAKKVKVTP